MADSIVPANMLLHPLYYNKVSLSSLKITLAFHLLLVFAENQRDFKIVNGIRTTKALENGNLDNRGPTVHMQCWHDTFNFKI